MENWKTILTFTYPHEAHMAKGFLESEGIETLIQDEMTAQVNNFYSNAIGGVKILVKDKDFEESVVILQKGGYLNRENTEANTVIETYYISSKTEITKCPYCGSENIAVARKPNILSVIIVFIVNAFLPIFNRYYHCFECRKQWRFKMKTN